MSSSWTATRPRSVTARISWPSSVMRPSLPFKCAWRPSSFMKNVTRGSRTPIWSSCSKNCASRAVICHIIRPCSTFTRRKFWIRCATWGRKSRPSSSSGFTRCATTLRETRYPMPPRAAPTTISSVARTPFLLMAVRARGRASTRLGKSKGERRSGERSRGGRGRTSRRRRGRLLAPALVPPHPLGGAAADLRLDRRGEARGELAHAVPPARQLGRDGGHPHEMPALGAALHEDGHHGNTRAQREERRAGRRVRGAAEEGDEDPGAARVLVDQHGDDAVSTERLAPRGDEARIVSPQDLDPGRRPDADDERVETEVVHAPHDHRDRVADGRRPRREELPVADVPRDRDGAPPPDERRVERLDPLEADVVGPAQDLLEQRQLGERLPRVAEGLAHQPPSGC